VADQSDWLARIVERFEQSDGHGALREFPHRTMSAWIKHGVVVFCSYIRELDCVGKGFCAAASFLKRAIAGVWLSGRSLFGSIGGWPPLGDASVTSTPASLKTKYGAANSSL
jgi:hypothetical protein